MTATQHEGPKADAPLEQRRQEEREQYRELQAGLVRRHLQVTAERRAIDNYVRDRSLAALKKLVAEGALPGIKR